MWSPDLGDTSLSASDGVNFRAFTSIEQLGRLGRGPENLAASGATNLLWSADIHSPDGLIEAEHEPKLPRVVLTTKHSHNKMFRVIPSQDNLLCVLFCTILVDQDSQKPIVIGRAGAMIKRIGTAARQDLERSFERRRIWICASK